MLKNFAWGIRNSWALKSAIPLIQNRRDRALKSCTLNPESTAWHLESQTVLKSLIWGEALHTIPSHKWTGQMDHSSNKQILQTQPG